MKNQAKMERRERMSQILAAALGAAARSNYSKLTREDIARAADVPASLITYHLGTMDNVRRELMRAAVRGKHLSVIAQGLALRDRHALKAPPEVRAAALQTLGG